MGPIGLMGLLPWALRGRQAAGACTDAYSPTRLLLLTRHVEAVHLDGEALLGVGVKRGAVLVRQHEQEEPDEGALSARVRIQHLQAVASGRAAAPTVRAAEVLPLSLPRGVTRSFLFPQSCREHDMMRSASTTHPRAAGQVGKGRRMDSWPDGDNLRCNAQRPSKEASL